MRQSFFSFRRFGCFFGSAVSLCASLMAFGYGKSALARDVVFLTLEYPPYSSEAMPENGAIIDVLRQALKGTQWNVKVNYVPWLRAARELQEGHADGALPLWPEEVKLFGVIPTHPVFESKLGFFVRNSDWDTATVALDTMRGKRVCTVRGYGYPDALMASGIVRDDANDDEANLKRVSMGRCDFVALERAVGQYLMSKAKPWVIDAPVSWKEPAFAALPLYIGISSKRPDSAVLLADIENGIARMKKDGRFAAIVKALALDVPTGKNR